MRKYAREYADHPLAIVIYAVIVAAVVATITVQFAAPPKAHAASQFANIICDGSKPINIAAANTQVITAGNGNMFLYVCSLSLSTAAATTFSVVEGTGTTCATNTLAVYGGTAAAVPLSTSPMNYGGGSGAVFRTAVAGDNLCIFTAGTIAGGLSWTTSAF
jgi:hypothetical protein